MNTKAITLEEREKILGWKLIIPSLLIICSLILYPVAYNIYLSFFKVSLDPRIPKRFVGLANYRHILKDSGFWTAFGTNWLFTIMTVAGNVLIGLAVALLLNRKFPGRWFVRAIVLLPYVTPVISTVFVWKYIFYPIDGPFLNIFANTLHLVKPNVDIVNNTKNAIWVVTIFNIWRNFPFAYLMFLATLQSIPASLYEAAEIDGANVWHKFRYITLPELYFVMGALVLLRGIWNFYKFDEVYLMSKFANTLPVYIYEKAFSGLPEQGVAASMSTLLFIILMVFIWLYVKKVLKW
ncbi:MAG: sugar ABC transporter permease [Thermotogae bacterium]|nr:sugar ABC transporter permease [Thermotogota bacterium]